MVTLQTNYAGEINQGLTNVKIIYPKNDFNQLITGHKYFKDERNIQVKMS